MTDPTKVTVDLADASYDIHIGAGLLDRTGAVLKPVLGVRKLAVVADRNAAELHLQQLVSAVNAAGFDATPFIVDSGEGSKCFARYADLVEDVLELNIGRDGAVVALGGGVVGDLAGFVAATVYRGVALVQIPTTLLAQVDSSVGGKTGINSRHGKNLIGAFHQPRIVLADTGLLATLPDREMRAGYAEIAKMGLLGNAEFFAWLEAHGTEVVTREPTALRHAIQVACAEKARIVGADIADHDARALLNLGHTFGHAFELAEGYTGALAHGEAVAVGLVLAAEMSARMRLCDGSIPVRVREHLQQVGLPIRASELAGAPFDAATVMTAMTRDKKYVGGEPVLILLRGVGEAFVCESPDRTLLDELVRGACDGSI